MAESRRRVCGFTVLLNLMVLGIALHSDAAMSPAGKLDPYLAPLLLRPDPSTTYLKDIVRNGHIPVLLRTNGDPRGLSRYGVQVRTVAGDVASADIPLESLRHVLAAPEVRYVEGARRVKPAAPMLDKSAVLIGATDVHRSNPAYTGKGVAVGIIDTGIDLTHPAFQTSTGLTRIVALWDQVVTTDGRTPPETNYGTEYSPADIDQGRAAHVRDMSGHGTHVASVIAGNGQLATSGPDARRTPQYVGVAPDANIIFVRTTYLSADLLDAAAFVLLRARQFGMPVVVNMSFGNSWGPHDGRSALGDGLQALIQGQTGEAMVAAAGNEGDVKTHARVTLRQGDPPKRLYLKPGFGEESAFVEIWMETNAKIEVRPLYPRNNAGDLGDFGVGQVAAGGVGSVILPNGPARGLDSLVIFRAPHPDFTNLNQIYATFSRAGDNGVPLDSFEYALEISGVGTIDAYVHDAEFMERPSDRDGIVPDSLRTVSIPGEEDLIISATSVASSDSWFDLNGNFLVRPNLPVGERSSYGSIGPRRDDAQEPDVAAPGEYVIGAFSSEARFLAGTGRLTPDGKYMILRGTSLSTAHVSGQVALLLQQNPTLPTDQIVARVRNSTREGIWTPELGMGLLVANKLLNVPTTPTGLRATASGNAATLTWTPNPEADVASYRVSLNGTVRDAGRTTSLQVTDFPAGRATAFVVAVNSAGRQSAPSDEIVLFPDRVLLPPPANVRVQAFDGGLTLQWNPVPGAATYRIKWGVIEGQHPNQADVAANAGALRGFTNNLTYYLVVTAVDSQGREGSESAEVRAAPRPRPALPFSDVPTREGFPIETPDDLFGAPTVADVDADGKMEIFVAGSDGKVYAYRADGSPLTGWPQDAGAPMVGSVSIGDVDLDGALEIFASAERRVMGWKADGTRFRGFPVTVPNLIRAEPVLANMDREPQLEILVSVAEGQAGVYAWDYQGKAVSGFPALFEQPSYAYTSPIVADMDFDGEGEVYAASAWGPIYSWNAKGTARAQFPVMPEGGVQPHATPMFAALDASGELSLIATGGSTGAFALDKSSKVRDGFPAGIMTETDSAVSVGDIDGDGNPEILAADRFGYLFAWRPDGTLLENYPLSMGDVCDVTPLLADLDGDPAAEIVLVANEQNNFGALIFVLKGDGTILDFVRLDVNVVSTPALADLDGDGQVELIATTLRRQADRENPVDFPALGGRVFVWNLPYSMKRADWTTHMGNIQRTGVSPAGLLPASVMSPVQVRWQKNQVRLTWKTTQERGNLGWQVFRSESADGPFAPISDRLYRPRGINSDNTNEYTVDDATANVAKSYFYRIVNYGSMNRQTVSDVIQIKSLLESTLVTTWGKTKSLEVLALFPNPANPEVWIPFALGEENPVTVTVYDTLGNEVRRLELGKLPVGDYTTRNRAAYWDGANAQGEQVASGVYYVEVRAGTHRSPLRRALILK